MKCLRGMECLRSAIFASDFFGEIFFFFICDDVLVLFEAIQVYRYQFLSALVSLDKAPTCSRSIAPNTPPCRTRAYGRIQYTSKYWTPRSFTLPWSRRVLPRSNSIPELNRPFPAWTLQQGRSKEKRLAKSFERQFRFGSRTRKSS